MARRNKERHFINRLITKQEELALAYEPDYQIKGVVFVEPFMVVGGQECGPVAE